VLGKAIAMDESLQGEVALIRDDYAVGPLAQPGSAEGWQARRQWWRMLLEANGHADAEERLNMVDDKMTVHQLGQKLDADESECLWIWAAQNKHDVSGYYWLVSQLQAYQGRIFILYLNNLPFFNEKGGIFYPAWLSEIPPKEFLKAKKLARPVTPSEFEIDADEWNRLCQQSQMVRLLEGGKKLAQAAVEFYDDALAKYVTGDFNKAQKILNQFFAKEKETTGDVFLAWRLTVLASERGWEIKGDMSKGPKDYDLRNPALPPQRKKGEADIAAEA
jgi:hypothetical protein